MRDIDTVCLCVLKSKFTTSVIYLIQFPIVVSSILLVFRYLPFYLTSAVREGVVRINFTVQQLIRFTRYFIIVTISMAVSGRMFDETNIFDGIRNNFSVM